MTGPSRPLVLTSDSELLDDVLRVGVAAAVELEVAPDPGAARRVWAAAPLVLVGDDMTGAVMQVAMPPRPGVLLVGRDRDDAELWQRAVRIGADDVVIVPDDDNSLARRLADAIEGEEIGGGLVCVIGGRGGAGASTLAAGLAMTAVRRGMSCLLVDADPLGGGLDLVLGYENIPGLRWPQLSESRGRISGAALRDALPAGRGGFGSGPVLPLVSCDRADLADIPADGMVAILEAGRRFADLAVVDLPRSRTEAGEAALVRSTLALVLVPAEVRATAAADRVGRLVGGYSSDVRVVVRDPRPSALNAQVIASSLGFPLAGQLRSEPAVAAGLDRGVAPARSGRGPLAALCDRIIDTHLAVGRTAVR